MVGGKEAIREKGEKAIAIRNYSCVLTASVQNLDGPEPVTK